MFLLNTYFVKLECDKVPVYNLMLIHKSHIQHKKEESPETIQFTENCKKINTFRDFKTIE